MRLTNDQFMADLERDYPNENWDAVPDPETFPDVYTVHGKQHESQYMKGMTPPYWHHYQLSFTVDAEYATIEEAQAQVERCKTWEDVVLDSLEIRNVKPRHACDKWMLKMFREDILAGKKVFPMYLP